MSRSRPSRDRQRGNSLLLALIVLSSLAALGSLTVVSVQSSLKASTNERSQAIAMYAAESGGAMAIEFLRTNYDPVNFWSNFVSPNNTPTIPLGLPSSGAAPGAVDNPFTIDQNASFTVEVFNNRDDPRYADVFPNDSDGQVVLRVTGRGPQGSVAILEWELRRYEAPGAPLPPPPAPRLPQQIPVILLGMHVVL
jgi:hypothetical protein